MWTSLISIRISTATVGRARAKEYVLCYHNRDFPLWSTGHPPKNLY